MKRIARTWDALDWMCALVLASAWSYFGSHVFVAWIAGALEVR